MMVDGQIQSERPSYKDADSFYCKLTHICCIDYF